MMTKEELDEVEYFAAQLYSTSRLAQILEIDREQLRIDILAGKTEVAQAIIRGRTTRETAIRESILDSAVNGSSPAQNAAIQMLKELDQ